MFLDPCINSVMLKNMEINCTVAPDNQYITHFFGSTLVELLESSLRVMRSCTPVLLALFLPAR